MKKDPRIFLNHILESIKDIENFSKEISKNEFVKDKLRQNAIIRELEIIGEAVKNLPKDFIKKYPGTPWNKIAKTRDKIIHHYFGLDLEIIWNVVVKDLPNLKKEIKGILKKEK